MSEKLESLQRKVESAKRELHYLDNKEKILRNKMQQLGRKERTHRLCSRGAMLESFLFEPELITDEQVMELLKAAFKQPQLKEMLSKMKEEIEGGDVTDPLV